MTFLVDVLGPDDNYYQACSSFQAIQICRNIIVEQSCFKQALACISILIFNLEMNEISKVDINYPKESFRNFSISQKGRNFVVQQKTKKG